MNDASLAEVFSRLELKIFDSIGDRRKAQEIAADWKLVEEVLGPGTRVEPSVREAFSSLAANHARIAQSAFEALTLVAEQEDLLRSMARTRQREMRYETEPEVDSDHPRSIFRDWMLQHLDDPFPSAADRRKLITQVRLSPDESTQQGALDATAVKNFFQNLRRRCGFTSLLRECFNEDRYRCGEAVRRVMKGITDEERAKETPEQRMVRERIERIRDYVAGKFESTKVGDWLKSVIDEHKLSGARARSVSVAPSTTSTGGRRKKQRVSSDSPVASSISAASDALDDAHDRFHKPSSHHRTPSTLSPCFSSLSMRSASGSSSVSAVSDALLRTPGRSVSGSSAGSSMSPRTPGEGLSVAGSPASTFSAGSPSESIAPPDPSCSDTIHAAFERYVPYSQQIPRISHHSSNPPAGDFDQPAWVPIGDIRDLDPALAADLGFVLPEPARFRTPHHDLDPLIDPSLQDDDVPLHLPLDFDFRPALPPAVDSLVLPEVPTWHDPDEPFPAFNFWMPPPATSHSPRDHHPLVPAIDVHPPSARPLLSEDYTESPLELTPSVVREQGSRLPRKTGKRKDAGTRTAQAASTLPEPDLSIEAHVEADAGAVKAQASKKSRGAGQKPTQQPKKAAKQPKQKIIKVYSFD